MSDSSQAWRVEEVEPHWFAGAPRAASLEEMWSRAEKALVPCGITRVADLTGLDTVRVPVAAAYRPNSRSLAVSQGKGTNWEACRLSAVMEGIEFDHAERITSPVVLSAARDLEGAHVLAGLPSQSTDAFDSSRPLLWIRGEALFTGEPCWAPFAAVSLDMTLPPGYGTVGLDRGSNGLASGATKLEAVVHAVTELIERDAAALWDLGDLAGTTSIDPSSLPDVGALTIIARCRLGGLTVALFDVTSDVGIPCVRAEVVDAERNDFRLVAAAAGFGCHLHPGVAALRAVTEAVQTRMVFVSGARDDLARRAFSARRDAEAIELQRQGIVAASVRSQSWPHTSPGAMLAASRDSSFEADVVDGAPTNRFGLLRQLSKSLDALRQVGLTEGCIVDLSRPSIGIPVVKVLVPGLVGAMAVGASDLVLERRALDAIRAAEPAHRERSGGADE